MKIDDVYIELNEIKKTERKRITVVQSEVDHLLYIKKEYYYKEYNNHFFVLYNQIKNLHCSYFPYVEMIDQNDEKITIIEQYINAPTLDVYLCNHQMNKKEAIHIFIKICIAVKKLHNLNPPIIHRDIKPENIFIDRDKVYLFDFDIARHYDQTKNKDTHILGSVGYASPEQFGFQQSDEKSDIYALGVLLNVLLTKQMPSVCLFQGNERKVIEKATEIDPRRRYQNIEELLKDLQMLNREKIFLHICVLFLVFVQILF